MCDESHLNLSRVHLSWDEPVSLPIGGQQMRPACPPAKRKAEHSYGFANSPPCEKAKLRNRSRIEERLLKRTGDSSW